MEERLEDTDLSIGEVLDKYSVTISERMKEAGIIYKMNTFISVNKTGTHFGIYIYYPEAIKTNNGVEYPMVEKID
jgi:hypothetical protein